MENKINELFKDWKLAPTRGNMDTLMSEVRQRIVERYSQVQDAEDVAQDACAEIWIAVMSGTYDDRGKFAAFCATVARRQMQDFYRLQERDPVCLDDQVLHIIHQKNS